uniref:60S ribosomal protein L29 n=1 Tax=Monodon monoceros TaxID=40151 RepID=A0A8C6AQE9_MONMO
MTKSKNHTMNKHSRNWHRNGIKKPQSQRYETLKGVDPKFLRNVDFLQATKARAMSERAKAIKALVKPKEVKPKIPKGGSPKLGQPAYITHPNLRKHYCACLTKGLRFCWPKSKAQTSYTILPGSFFSLIPPHPIPKSYQFCLQKASNTSHLYHHYLHQTTARASSASTLTLSKPLSTEQSK